VLLPLLCHKPLTNWAEGIYGRISREMRSRECSSLTGLSTLVTKKPPVMLGSPAAFFSKIFGVTEFWAPSRLRTIRRRHRRYSLHGRMAGTHGTSRRGSDGNSLRHFGSFTVCRVLGEMDVLPLTGCCLHREYCGSPPIQDREDPTSCGW